MRTISILPGAAGFHSARSAVRHLRVWDSGAVFQLRFTTVVEAPLSVAFDVARALGRPWGAPLSEVVSVRPFRDVYVLGPGHGFRWLVHSRRFSATGAGTLV